MAEVFTMRNNIFGYPVYGLTYTVVFPILDADGDLVSGATGLDSEVSLNGDTFADCTNEATEIATSSGMYYLTLTGAEMTAEVVTVIVKTSTTDAKTTPMVFYPRKMRSIIRSGTAQGGASDSVTLDSGASAVDQFYTGMAVIVSVDGLFTIRLITDYNGSTKVATVAPDYGTVPDNNDSFTVYLIPEVTQIQQGNTTAWNGTQVATPATAGIPDVNAKNWNNLATVALPLVPTTAGRTLDVSTGGEAGLDWANIGSPTTTQNLSGTTVKAVTDAVGANVTSINSVSTSSVTAVNANLGTTQPVNFTGTGASALVKSDTVDIAGAAVSTSTAQVGVNVVNWKGSAAATVDTAGYPVVTIKDGTGQGEIATTAGAVDTVTTVTNLTNAATAGDLTATMKTSVTTAASAATPALSAAGVDAIWDEAVDGSVTARQSLRLANSANGGILSGAATTTVAIRDLADTKDRVSATVDASGNRTAVTRDLT